MVGSMKKYKYSADSDSLLLHRSKFVAVPRIGAKLRRRAPRHAERNTRV